MEGGIICAQCNICKKIFKNGSTGTSGLRYHISNKHPSSQSTPSVAQFFSPRAPYSSSSMHKKRLDRLCLEMIVKDMRPLSCVDAPGLTAFVKALDPQYKLPSRQAITSMLPKMYAGMMADLMKDAEKWKHAALTTDLWTSCTNISFISVTAHFMEVIFNHIFNYYRGVYILQFVFSRDT